MKLLNAVKQLCIDNIELVFIVINILLVAIIAYFFGNNDEYRGNLRHRVLESRKKVQQIYSENRPQPNHNYERCNNE